MTDPFREPPPDRETFFPESLCHDCAAPPRFTRSDRGAVFLWCPLWKRYPPQPVRTCEKFVGEIRKNET